MPHDRHHDFRGAIADLRLAGDTAHFELDIPGAPIALQARAQGAETSRFLAALGEGAEIRTRGTLERTTFTDADGEDFEDTVLRVFLIGAAAALPVAA